jgi:tetratricopeptide (TPR) repeat protein
MPLTDMVNEHRPYLPSAGLFVLVGLGVVALVRGRVKPALAITGVLALALGALTHARNRVFATEETFWTEIVAKEPRSVRALVNLGVVRLQQRDLASAEALFRRALELEPSYLFARLNLGAVLGELRRPREALAELDEAVRLAPTLADPYYARGTVRAKLGDLHGALADMKLAVERAPVPTRELKQMWEILDALGRREEARKVAQRGFALDPQLFGPLLRR